jgi:hypothetical protein
MPRNVRLSLVTQSAEQREGTDKYSPDDKRPPKVSKSFFSWIVPLVSVKEAWMMDRIGMDATVYLRFLRMLRWMCVDSL